ncbi:putative LysE/YggA type lysine exporter, partial [Yersinia pestis PY-46]
RLPPGSDFRRWVWITIAPFVTLFVGGVMGFIAFQLARQGFGL